LERGSAIARGGQRFTGRGDFGGLLVSRNARSKFWHSTPQPEEHSLRGSEGPKPDCPITLGEEGG